MFTRFCKKWKGATHRNISCFVKSRGAGEARNTFFMTLSGNFKSMKGTNHLILWARLQFKTAQRSQNTCFYSVCVLFLSPARLRKMSMFWGVGAVVGEGGGAVEGGDR